MYTIVDDGDEINIRATITQRWELAELVTKLQKRVDGMPVNITTTRLAHAETGHVISAGEGYTTDAIDVNQREQDHE